MGVRIMRLNEKDKVVSVTQVMTEDDEIDEGTATGTEENNENKDGYENDETVRKIEGDETDDIDTIGAEENNENTSDAEENEDN